MVRLRKDPKRTESSRRWLERQMSDPYVKQAKKDGYRSRAAYKLIELNQKYKFLKPGDHVLDLGAAPGGWLQVAVKLVQSPTSTPRVVGVDLLPVEPLAGAIAFEADFTAQDTPQRLIEALGTRPNVILSDLAPSTTGHAATDHLRILGIVEEAYDFSRDVLASGGAFVAKVFQGGTEKDLLLRLKKDFEKVMHSKPPASRKESSELYVVALGFRATAESPE